MATLIKLSRQNLLVQMKYILKCPVSQLTFIAVNELSLSLSSYFFTLYVCRKKPHKQTKDFSTPTVITQRSTKRRHAAVTAEALPLLKTHSLVGAGVFLACGAGP